MTQALAAGLSALGLDLPVVAREQLLAYVALIQKWNKVYNLTAIRAPERMISEHLLDSLAVVPHVPPGSLLDLGSGAGLPGIPLAIARADLKVTLLDSSQKKCAFMRQATIELGLMDVEVVCSRAEAYRPAQGFDSVIARAFSDLATIAMLAVPLVAAGGRVLAMKGAEPRAELERLAPSAAVEAVIRLNVPGLRAERHLVVMTKA